MKGFQPIYNKVIAAGAGAGAGTVLTAFLTWCLGLAWGGSAAATAAVTTAALVPLPVTGLLALVLVVGGTILCGYAKTETVGDAASPPLRT